MTIGGVDEMVRVGGDVELENAVTEFGLHRRHMRRSHGIIDPAQYLNWLPDDAYGVKWTMYEDEQGACHLIYWWKLGSERGKYRETPW